MCPHDQFLANELEVEYSVRHRVLLRYVGYPPLFLCPCSVLLSDADVVAGALATIWNHVATWTMEVLPPPPTGVERHWEHGLLITREAAGSVLGCLTDSLWNERTRKVLFCYSYYVGSLLLATE